MDGKYFGAQILDTPGVIQGATFPSVPPVMPGAPTVMTGFGSGALLDSMDGKIDGKFFGANIVESGLTGGLVGSSFVGGMSYPSTTVTAAGRALDAADGKIDGKFFGAPIVEGTGVSYFGSMVTAPTVGVAAPQYPTVTSSVATMAAPTQVELVPVQEQKLVPVMTTTMVPMMRPAPPTYTFMPPPPPMPMPMLPPPAPTFTFKPMPLPMAPPPPPPPPMVLPPPPPPAPMPAPPPPPPAPPAPDVSKYTTKISELEAQITTLKGLEGELARLKGLEGELALAKESEGGLKAQIAELHLKIEVMMREQVSASGCEEKLANAIRQIQMLEQQKEEAHKHIAFLEMQLRTADERIAGMAGHIKQLEAEIAELKMRLTKAEATATRRASLTQSQRVTETYKVKTFDLAAKLAKADGSDDGLYNGLPIEVDGKGLYRDLVKAGWTVSTHGAAAASGGSHTTKQETYMVDTFEMAEKLAKMDGTDDGMYNDLPIEVKGEGLYRDLVRAGRKSSVKPASVTSTSSSSGTYKVSSMEMAAKISAMGGADDGTYKGLPIEVTGMGLYNDLRKK
jgi:TolA-binding protein